MSENTVVTVGGAYKESDDHVPDATDQFGTLDTSATAGSAHGQVDAVTPIFDVAKAQDALTAKRALDPNDSGVDASLVVLPQGMVIAEDGAAEARKRIEDAEVKPVEVGGPNAYQEAAAESGDAAAADAEAQQENTGAGTTGSTDTSRQTNTTTTKASTTKA